MRRSLVAAVAGLGLLASIVRLQAQEPLDLIPADALLSWNARPLPEASAEDRPPSPLATLLDAGTRIAGSPLKPRVQIALRLAEAFGVAIRYPFALALLDAKAVPTADGRGRRVDDLQIALVVHNDGRSEHFLKIVQKVVNEQTDSAQATLERKTAARWTYDELRDKRLTESIAWGQIGPHFVVTYGTGTWPRIAAVAADESLSMSHDAWIKKIRESYAERPLIEIIGEAKAIRQRLDPHVQGRATAFFEAWSAADIERAHWALGFQGNALYCIANSLVDGETKRRVYADPAERDPAALALVPGAARYAIYRLKLETFLPRLFGSFYATRDRDERDAAQRVLKKIETEHGFSVEKDILANLGELVILHNDPPHPLRIPLCFTSLIEIRSNPARVREVAEAVCRGWQAAIEATNETGKPSGAVLGRDDDGIWFFQYGPVAGLAWTFTDKYIVTSWSPAALRDYLRRIGDKAGKRFP